MAAFLSKIVLSIDLFLVNKHGLNYSEVRPPRPGLQLREFKISAPPSKRMPCLKKILRLHWNICHVVKFTNEEDDFLKKVRN